MNPEPLLDPEVARLLRTFGATVLLVGACVVVLSLLVFGALYAVLGGMPAPCVVSPIAAEWHSCPGGEAAEVRTIAGQPYLLCGCAAVLVTPASPSPEPSP